MDHQTIGGYMTNEEFNKRCLEDYSSYVCKGCKYSKIIHGTLYECKQFPDLEVKEDFTCKLWESKDG